MYSIGEYVVYGNKGVCRIDKIGPIDIPGMSADRDYYTMTQVYSKSSVIFTPVDNAVLRRVISKDDTMKLIHDSIEFEPEWIPNDKERERAFVETLRTADSEKLIRMIKTLAHRRDQRVADGKKATSTDERYYHAAEDILYGEFGIALGMEKNLVKPFVLSEIGHKK